MSNLNKNAEKLQRELLEYQRRESAFKIHLRIKDNKIKELEEEIKEIKGGKNGRLDNNEND